MWVYLHPDAPVVDRTLWREGRGTTRHLGITAVDNKLWFQIQTSDGTWHNAIDSQVFPTGQWVFVAAVFSTTDGMKLYRQGLLVGSDPNTVNDIEGRGVDIGATPGNNIWWNGTIDEVRIYNRALTEEEIKALYYAGLTNKFNVTFYLLNDGNAVLGRNFNVLLLLSNGSTVSKSFSLGYDFGLIILMLM